MVLHMHEWATLKRARRQFLIFCEHHSPASTFLSSCECFRFSNPWLTFIIPLSRKSNKSVNWPDGKLKKRKSPRCPNSTFPDLWRVRCKYRNKRRGPVDVDDTGVTKWWATPSQISCVGKKNQSEKSFIDLSPPSELGSELGSSGCGFSLNVSSFKLSQISCEIGRTKWMNSSWRLKS